MKNTLLLLVLLSVVATATAQQTVTAQQAATVQQAGKTGKRLPSVLAIDAVDPPAVSILSDSEILDGNNITMWCMNNGIMAHNPKSDDVGFEWPAGSGKHLLYFTGLVFGGTVQKTGKLYVNGTIFRTGFQPGAILPDGSASDPDDPVNRIYKIRNLDRAGWSLLTTEQQQQLRSDFVGWPVQFGAPFYDGDGDGLYTPDFDAFLDGASEQDTPQFVGDVMLWFVMNDLDSTQTANVFGSEPVGLQVSVLLWSSDDDPVLNNTVFTKYTIINRSDSDILDAFAGCYKDPDLGRAVDDYIGVDTAYAMDYTYNGRPIDDVYGIPPALGFVWLQTPVVASPGDTARVNFALKPGYRNIPLYSFHPLLKNHLDFRGPDIGVIQGGVQMYHLLNGKSFRGDDFIDPLTKEVTRFPFSGDPVTGSGWILSQEWSPEDMRSCSAAGPFTLAVSDTQEVVIAMTVGQGADNLLGIDELRFNAHHLHWDFPHVSNATRLVSSSYTMHYPTNSSFLLKVRATIEGADVVVAELVSEERSEILNFPLFDDGVHGDGAAGDNVYGGEITDATYPRGGDLYLRTHDSDQHVKYYHLVSKLPLPGPLVTANGGILSDHLNYDHRANPGEHCRVDIRLENRTQYPLGRFEIRPGSVTFDFPLTIVDTMLLSGEQLLTETLDSYITVTVPENAVPGTTLEIPVLLRASQYSEWKDTVLVEVMAFDPVPECGLLEHVLGPASGSLGWRVAEGAALTDHTYRVTVQGEDWEEKTLTVIDEMAGQLLYSGLAVPDVYGHDSQTIDGWKLNIGSAGDKIIYDSSGRTLGNASGPTYTFSAPDRAWFQPLMDYFFYGEEFFGSRLKVFDSMPVKLIFDRRHGQKAYCYVRGAPRYANSGYFDVPLRAYDISDSANPRQITLAFIEQDGTPGHDSTWMPTDSQGDREYLFIIADSYTEAADPWFETIILEIIESTDVVYAVWPLLDSTKQMFENGDELLIQPIIPISNRDEYLLINPRLTNVESVETPVEGYALHQNYPNPFNPSTTIRFETPEAGTVHLLLYDALGRRVRVLVDQHLTAGMHTVRLSAETLSAGTYFYSLTAGETRLTRAMILAR